MDEWWLKLPATVFQFGAFVATCFTLLYSLKMQRILKSTDVRMAFQSRYESVVYEFKNMVGDDPELARVFFARFCGLQLDQFHAWIDGLVSDYAYKYWMYIRVIDAGKE